MEVESEFLRIKMDQIAKVKSWKDMKKLLMKYRWGRFALIMARYSRLMLQ